MTTSKGKFYLWLNEAAIQRLFWTGDTWTVDAKLAAFFESLAEAHNETARAAQTTTAEVIVDQATRNVFE